MKKRIDVCPKCGSDEVSAVQYHRDSGGCCGFGSAKRSDEHLHKRCGTCGVDWTCDTQDKRKRSE